MLTRNHQIGHTYNCIVVLINNHNTCCDSIATCHEFSSEPLVFFSRTKFMPSIECNIVTIYQYYENCNGTISSMVYLNYAVRSTREHSLMPIHYHSNQFGRSYFPSTINAWNSLPSSTHSCTSIATFKYALSH